MNKLTIFNKKIFLGLLFSLVSTFVLATEQVPDLVIYKNDTFYLNGIFEEEFPLFTILKNNNYKKLFSFNENCVSSACHRGYQATWEIRDDEIFLREIKKCCTGELIELDKIFGEKDVKALWLTSTITISAVPINVFNINEYLKEEIAIIELNIKEGEVLSIQHSE